MDGVLVAGQAAGRVSLQGCALFIDAFNTLDCINGEYLMRGDDVANVNCNFVILGFKCDRYSRQGLLHSVAGMSNEDKTRHRETLERSAQTLSGLCVAYREGQLCCCTDASGPLAGGMWT